MAESWIPPATKDPRPDVPFNPKKTKTYQQITAAPLLILDNDLSCDQAADLLEKIHNGLQCGETAKYFARSVFAEPMLMEALHTMLSVANKLRVAELFRARESAGDF